MADYQNNPDDLDELADYYDHCVICGKPATTELDEETPLCGSPKCAYAAQAAADFHDECGSR